MKLAPKEKAKQILYELGWHVHSSEQKSAALFCVEEIIKANPWHQISGVPDSIMSYWQQVKEELQKM